MTLGKRLAQNNSARAEREAHAQRTRAEQLETARLAGHRAVAAFFDSARKYFTDGILQGLPSADLGLQVGAFKMDEECPDASQHPHIWKLFQVCERSAWRVSGSGNPFGEPRAIQRGHGTYAAEWSDFQAWAKSQGLHASFSTRYSDDENLDYYWQLSVSPAR